MSSYDSIILASSPVRYYPLNDITGTTAIDLTGNSNGTYSGGMTLGQAGPNGDLSAKFDGSTGVVTASSPVINLPLSIEIWMMVTGSQTDRYPICLSSAGSYANSQGIALNATDYMYSQSYNGSNNRFASSFQQPPFNNWHHLVATMSSTQIYFYYNTSAYASFSSFTSAADLAVLKIGGADWYTDKFAGYISRVAIYDRILTSVEVTAHYTAGKYWEHWESF